MLKELIPVDMIRTMAPDDWKKQILSKYNQDYGMPPSDAKIKFLKAIYQWPTFGSAFFEVKVKEFN